MAAILPVSARPAAGPLTRVDPVTGRAEAISVHARIAALVERDDAKRAVRAVDPQTLFGLVHEAGLHDAFDLVMAASAAQCQAFLDFDCWNRDELATDRYSEWLQILLQRDDDAFAAMYWHQDMEPMVIFLKQHIQVFQWEEDMELLDVIDDPVMSSPCGVYALVVPDGEEVAGLVRLLLERIYAIDLIQGHRVLEAVRWETESEMQAYAYERRMARLGDLGFVPFEEAVEVYAWLDPASFADKARADATADAPAFQLLRTIGDLPPVDVHVQHLQVRLYDEGTTLFHRALRALGTVVPPEELGGAADALLSQLRALINRVQVADLGTPGDPETARLSLDAISDRISLALERIAGRNEELAVRVLLTQPLKMLHRAGFSATIALARQARKLVERGNLGVSQDLPISFLQEPQRDLLHGLARRRPLYSAVTARQFRSLADLEGAASTLGRIAFLELLFFGLMRIRHAELLAMLFDETRTQTPVETVSFRSLFATVMVSYLRGDGDEVRPVRLADLQRCLDEARKSDDPLSFWTNAALDILRLRIRDEDQTAGLARAFGTEVAAWLTEETEALSGPIEPAIAQQLVVLAP